jgi:hypothetical protein
MKKTIGMFLTICIFTGLGSLLMSEELLELEIVKKPTFKEVGGFWYVYMDVTCPKNKMRETGMACIKELEKQGIKSDWTFLIFYNWPETEDGILKWFRGVVVPGNTKCTPPLKIAKLEKFKCLAYTITGDFTIKEIGKGNRLMDKYIIDNGYKHIWPIYEITRPNPPQFHFWYLVEE